MGEQKESVHITALETIREELHSLRGLLLNNSSSLYDLVDKLEKGDKSKSIFSTEATSAKEGLLGDLHREIAGCFLSADASKSAIQKLNELI